MFLGLWKDGRVCAAKRLACENDKIARTEVAAVSDLHKRPMHMLC